MSKQGVMEEHTKPRKTVDDIVKLSLLDKSLPSSWQVIRLGEISKVLYGKSRSKSEDKGQIPVIGSGGVFGYTRDPLITHETIVIGRKGSAGSVYYCSEPSYPSDTTFYLDWKQKVAVPFIYYSLLFKGLAPDKSVIPSLQRGDVENITVVLPTLPEQKTIAKVLQKVQQAIRVRRDELKLERERKASLMEYLFTHGTRGETTKQTEIGDIPERWQVVELGEIITLHRGYDLPSKDRKPGIVPIISSSGISGTHSEAKVTAPGVVTGRYGTIGEVFYIEQDFWPLNTTLYVSEFRRVTPHFVTYLLRTLNFNIFNDKSTVPGVNRNDLHRIKTVLPTPSEQQVIVDVLSTHDTKLSALEQETALLEELFKSLLEELMTGRLSTLPLVEEESHE